MRKSAHFTLIELLVVVTIIGILMTLLMPSLNRAREAAKNAVCLSNQKQIGIAIMTYSEEGENYFPKIDKIDRFLLGRGDNGDEKSMWTCPTAVLRDYVTDEQPLAYTFSKNGLSWVDKKNHGLIAETSSSMILGDGRMNMPWGAWIMIDGDGPLWGYEHWNDETTFYNNGHELNDVVYVPGADVVASGAPSGLRYRHKMNKSINALFFDGHATGGGKSSFTKRNFVTAW